MARLITMTPHTTASIIPAMGPTTQCGCLRKGSQAWARYQVNNVNAPHAARASGYSENAVKIRGAMSATKTPPKAATGRDGQIKQRQVPRVRLELRQFVVTTHATREQRDAVRDDVVDQRNIRAGRNHAERSSRRHADEKPKNTTVIPSLAVEADDEGEQVDGKRHHPEKRNYPRSLGTSGWSWPTAARRRRLRGPAKSKSFPCRAP